MVITDPFLSVTLSTANTTVCASNTTAVPVTLSFVTVGNQTVPNSSGSDFQFAAFFQDPLQVGARLSVTSDPHGFCSVFNPPPGSSPWVFVYVRFYPVWCIADVVNPINWTYNMSVSVVFPRPGSVVVGGLLYSIAVNPPAGVTVQNGIRFDVQDCS